MTAHQYQNTLCQAVAQQRAATKIQTAFRRISTYTKVITQLKINIIAGVINEALSTSIMRQTFAECFPRQDYSDHTFIRVLNQFRYRFLNNRFHHCPKRLNKAIGYYRHQASNVIWGGLMELSFSQPSSPRAFIQKANQERRQLIASKA